MKELSLSNKELILSENFIVLRCLREKMRSSVWFFYRFSWVFVGDVTDLGWS